MIMNRQQHKIWIYANEGLLHVELFATTNWSSIQLKLIYHLNTC